MKTALVTRRFWRLLGTVVVGAGVLFSGLVAIVDYRYHGKVEEFVLRTELFLCGVPQKARPFGMFPLKTDSATHYRYPATVVSVSLQPGTPVREIKKIARAANTKIDGFSGIFFTGIESVLYFQLITEEGKEQESIDRLKSLPGVGSAHLQLLTVSAASDTRDTVRGKTLD